MPFNPNEIVIIQDGGIDYQAKVLKFINMGSNRKYYIHFMKWDKKYDKWVDEACLFKKEDSLNRNDKKRKLKSSSRVISSDDDTNKSISSLGNFESKLKNKEVQNKDSYLKKQRKQLLLKDLVDEDDEMFISKISIPISLKKQLVDDWTMITSSGKRLLKLPKPENANVSALIKDFISTKKEKDQADKFNGLFEGLEEQFEKALPSILLYRQEREQYDRLKGKHKYEPLSKIYGLEHLLRLFVRLPKLLSNVLLPSNELNQIFAKLGEFLRFCAKVSSKYINMENYIEEIDALKFIDE